MARQPGIDDDCADEVAHLAGARARRTGIQRAAHPYPAGDARSVRWQQGWDDAARLMAILADPAVPHFAATGAAPPPAATAALGHALDVMQRVLRQLVPEVARLTVSQKVLRGEAERALAAAREDIARLAQPHSQSHSGRGEGGAYAPAGCGPERQQAYAADGGSVAAVAAEDPGRVASAGAGPEAAPVRSGPPRAIEQARAAEWPYRNRPRAAAIVLWRRSCRS